MSIGLFADGIRPEWEDPQNEGGKIFIMEYLVTVNSESPDNFLKELAKGWSKLVLCTLGEIFDYSEYVIYILSLDKWN